MAGATLILMAVLLCACTSSPPAAESDFNLAGHITDKAIREASGLSRSRRDDRLWLINDGGSRPQLHAIGLDGSSQGSVTLTDIRNVDWEDLSSFENDGKHWLIVADIGDNNSKRDHCTLYIVEEPQDAQIAAGKLRVQRQISFVYPDGARDAESVAVDVANQQILILSKRDIPAVLYTLPLYPSTDGLLTATRIGEIDGIPQPTPYDIERAFPDLNWHWQPTAMSIASDGLTAAVLTYRATYVFKRVSGQSWFDALRMEPERFALGQYNEAEAVVFSSDGASLFATTENRNAPLLKLELPQNSTTGDLDE